jgi:hypothetical protein
MYFIFLLGLCFINEFLSLMSSFVTELSYEHWFFVAIEALRS